MCKRRPITDSFTPVIEKYKANRKEKEACLWIRSWLFWLFWCTWLPPLINDVSRNPNFFTTRRRKLQLQTSSYVNSHFTSSSFGSFSSNSLLLNSVLYFSWIFVQEWLLFVFANAWTVGMLRSNVAAIERGLFILSCKKKKAPSLFPHKNKLYTFKFLLFILTTLHE